MLKDALEGCDKAISLALGVIHHKTLVTQTQGQKSFKEVLISSSKSPPNTTIPNIPPSKAPSTHKPEKGNKCIFFSGIPENTQTKELWGFFRKLGKFKDIILPRKRDKFNNRYGFLHTASIYDAEKLLLALKDSPFRNKRLYVAYAHGESPIKSYHVPLDSNSNQLPSVVSLQPKRLDNNKLLAPIPGLAIRQGEDSSNTPVRPNIADLTSLAADCPTLQLNTNLAKELECSVLLETINKETEDTVSTLIEGLRFNDVIVRGLSSTKFLAFFYLEEDLTAVDLDFLGIGFKTVRKPEAKDLIPTRRTWVEIRGIPLSGWTEETSKSLFKKWGDIISYSEPMEDSSSILLPLVQIETSQINLIDHTGWAKIEDTMFNYRLLEKAMDHRVKQPAPIPFMEISLHPHPTIPEFCTKGTVSPMSTKSTSSLRSKENSPESPGSISSFSTIQDPIDSVAHTQWVNNGCSPCDHPLNIDKPTSTIEEQDATTKSFSVNSLVNPVTPTQPTITFQIDTNVSGDQNLVWDSRDPDIDNVSNSYSHSDIHLSILDDST